jgi:membrane protein required for colicin V production
MATLDLILLGALLVSTVLGWWRGFVFEVLSLLAWAAAFLLARWYAPAVADFLSKPLSLLVPSAGLRQALAFVVVFIASVFVGNLLAVVIKKLLAAVGLSSADRGLGALFGLLRGLVGVMALAWFLASAGLQSQTWVQQSKGIGYAQAGLQTISQFGIH